jgi:hypothetical protein
MSRPGQSVCEDCGARSESTAGWSKPSGTAGRETTFDQSVQPAPIMLGHDGCLCTRCWWRRA